MKKEYSTFIVVLFFLIGLFMGFSFGLLIYQQILTIQVEKIISAVKVNDVYFDIDFNQTKFIEDLRDMVGIEGIENNDTTN